MRDPVVLVLTQADDPTADLVITELNDRGLPVRRLDPGGFPHQVGAAVRFSTSGVSGSLRAPTGGVDLAHVRAVY